jgi:hypothetical protein
MIMGIFLYSLFGIAFSVLGIVCFTVDIEIWVGFVFLAFGLLCLGIAVYKLDEEFDFISKYLRKKREDKADKIAGGKFKKQPLHMVNMLIKSYEDRKTCGKEYLLRRAANNLTSGYKTMLANWKFVEKETNRFHENGGVEYIDKTLFECFESILILLICADEQLSGDYDAYCKICKRMSHTPRSKTEVRRLVDTLLDDKAKMGNEKLSIFYNSCRSCMPSGKYTDMVQGVCDLMLLDNVVHENEYLILRLLFEKDLDVFPKTWEQFKLEYK